MFKSIRKAIQTVNEVKQWGDDTTAYEDEQRVKRGENTTASQDDKSSQDSKK